MLDRDDRFLSPSALLLALLVVVPAAADGDDTSRRVKPGYTERGHVERPREARGAATLEVPEDLRVEVVVRTSEAAATTPRRATA